MRRIVNTEHINDLSVERRSKSWSFCSHARPASESQKVAFTAQLNKLSSKYSEQVHKAHNFA